MQKIIAKYRKHPEIQNVIQLLGEQNQIKLCRLLYSARSFFISALFEKLAQPIILIINDKEEAAYVYNDFLKIAASEKVFYFPSSVRHLTSGKKADGVSMVMRTETLTRIRKLSDFIVVTYPEAIAETVIDKSEIRKNSLELAVGDETDPDFLAEMFKDLDFKRVDYVMAPGQFAQRGSIVDVFSFDAENPYRIDFFDTVIESIRVFDIETQLSVKKIEKAFIVNNLQKKGEEKRIPFPKYLPDNSLIITDNDFIPDVVKNLYEQERQIFLEQDDLENFVFEYANPDDFVASCSKFKKIRLSHKSLDNCDVSFKIKEQLATGKNFNLLADDIFEKQQLGFQTFILSESAKQLERLQEILHSDEVELSVDFKAVTGSVYAGFYDYDLFVAVYTDHQIFSRYYKYKLKDYNISKSKEQQLLKEIKELNPGDYVVHSDYGIGVFRGLTFIENNGKKQEVVRIEYKDGDSLFVSVHALHKISKYKGQDAEAPKIHKLGTSTWKNLKKKTKKRIKDIAKDLIELYAKRMQEKGFAFSADSYLQEALEASFIYEETPDQLKAIEEVKKDMEKPVPMDRLVCGDVGFGKTEVAIRAAFKAVSDNKQVALLCPTTVLAFQHYRTFTERLKDMPVTVEFLSRMKSAKQQRQIIEDLAKGKIDIIIGTHRLVSKDVKFKDLGLLIIDEEQKFGVAVKEKLKQFRVNVDTLTLTATPIPRTLQFSLMGARDLSILQTPPPNRQPIITELHTFNLELIKKAIDYEIQRGGQVFFVHNHRASLPDMKKMINTVCPSVSVEIAHGQMKAAELEEVMTRFIQADFDVLLTTSIIENGLDIPNANTIIINNAQNFGLSDLHQLRGRVGRSNRKAFCYLLAPPLSGLKDTQRRRLKTIETFVDLGSGFNIALQDLDIRGAGDLLGAQQSGFINEIGYETFKRILAEAMIELKTSEYKDVFKDETKDQQTDYVADCQITTDLPAGLPDDYVPETVEKLKLYKELDSIQDIEKLKDFEQNLQDRFGELPQETKDLLNIVKIRLLAIKLAIDKITLKNNYFICYFTADKNSAFYDSPEFQKILAFVAQHEELCKMKEKNERLMLTFKDVETVSQAFELLKKLYSSVFATE